MLDLVGMMCAALISFVLVSAERNRREARPHGPALDLAGHATMSAAATLAVLLLAWVALSALGYLPEPVIT
jgi:predicted PhzF superfamily epimerase YddE/YHI9